VPVSLQEVSGFHAKSSGRRIAPLLLKKEGQIMMIAELSIMPVGKGESVSIWVSRAIEFIDRSGLKYQLGPMGTFIEGEWEQIAPVIGQCLRVVSRDCRRIQVSVRADYRTTATRSLDDLVRSVARVLGHPLPSSAGVF
jgi:uncharacterized protein (TIGR00106 family)